jgi:hypothetical protein
VTAGPGDNKAAGAGGRGHLRASHADREQAIGALKAAFVQGRLGKDELDLRVGQTLAARTYADLAAVTADLPAGPAGTQPPHRAARVRARQPVKRTVKSRVWVGLAAALLLATFLEAKSIVGVVVLALLAAGAQMLSSWHKRRSRGQLPPRPGQGGQALEGDQDSGLGHDLTLSGARNGARAHHLPGQGVLRRTWRSLTVRRAGAGMPAHSSRHNRPNPSTLGA